MERKERKPHLSEFPVTQQAFDRSHNNSRTRWLLSLLHKLGSWGSERLSDYPRSHSK